MTNYYQFIIYDNDNRDCYHESGDMITVSNLYTDRNCCEEQAQEDVNYYNEQYETEDRFQYEIIGVEVVK